MPRSKTAERSIDWRGWLALTWVVYFGFLYGKMIVERRGDKLRAVIRAFPGR